MGKLSALKRFEQISSSMCDPTSLSFLPDIRCSLDFDLVSENEESCPSPPFAKLPIERKLKRKRSETLFKDIFSNGNEYESPSKILKQDEEETRVNSKDITIPTVDGQHSDLKYMTSHTLETILNGERNLDKNVVIVDCRYPYEYEGGHIKGALNLYTKEAITNTFINQHRSMCNSILVFHCEFSSERGPKMCRFLREQDRSVHSDCYPQLYYSEMYVLQGGYKSFYKQCSLELCEPQQYTPMIHPTFNTQLKHYRKETKRWTRSKSWNGTSTESMAKVMTTLCFEL